MNGRTASIGLLTFSLLLSSCAGKPPEILRIFQQSSVVEDLEKNQITFQLSLFIQAEDPDGNDDLEELFFISDEHELFWSLDNESWIRTGSEESPWIGSNAIAMPDGSPLPAGEYRVLLRDIGGDSVEQTLTLPQRSLSEIKGMIPKVMLDEGTIRISANEGPYTLWLYDGTGQFFRAAVVEAETPVDKLVEQFPNLRQGFSFRVYIYHQAEKLGLQTGPYTVQP